MLKVFIDLLNSTEHICSERRISGSRPQPFFRQYCSTSPVFSSMERRWYSLVGQGVQIRYFRRGYPGQGRSQSECGSKCNQSCEYNGIPGGRSRKCRLVRIGCGTWMQPDFLQLCWANAGFGLWLNRHYGAKSFLRN